MYMLMTGDLTIDKSLSHIYLLQKHFNYRVKEEEDSYRIAMTINTEIYQNREDTTEFESSFTFSKEMFSSVSSPLDIKYVEHIMLTDKTCLYNFASKVLSQFGYSIWRAEKFI